MLFKSIGQFKSGTGRLVNISDDLKFIINSWCGKDNIKLLYPSTPIGKDYHELSLGFKWFECF